MRTKLTLTLGAALLFSGCASNKTQSENNTKPIHERPWVGGKFETVATPHSIQTNTPAFRQRGALLTRVHPDSPLARAGLQEGDLILRINGENVRFQRDIQKHVEQSESNPLTLTIYRDGELTEKTVTPGVEHYQNFNTVGFGLSLATKYQLDLYPNPDFSLIAIGYDVKRDRLDLTETTAKYRKSLEDQQGKPAGQSQWIGLRSDEGWQAWLGPIWLTRNKMIVSQQP